MDYDQLIIDGYNLLHFDSAFEGGGNKLATARQRLVRRIEQFAFGMANKVTIVFDGREHGRDASLDTSHLEILFSPSNRTADGLIEQMVHDASQPDRILVVTSDGTEQQIVSAFGASVISCREFLARGEATLPVRPKPPRNFTLGDHFPS
jgi:predicted RNA-binding protein with PIN domain